MHQRHLFNTPTVDRVIAKLAVRADGCWLFQGATRGGYGRIKTHSGPKAGTSAAHRVVWEALVGAIPPAHDLDHLCRNRACCNPGHLVPVTRSENLRRGNMARPGPRPWRRKGKQ